MSEVIGERALELGLGLEHDAAAAADARAREHRGGRGRGRAQRALDRREPERVEERPVVHAAVPVEERPARVPAGAARRRRRRRPCIRS